MRNRKPAAEGAKPPSIMRWVGYATAVLSLLGGLTGGVKYLYDRAQNRQQVAVLLSAAAEQSSNHDYTLAWSTLDRAATVDAHSDAVRTARQNLAMQWLDEIRITDNQHFSDITNKLQPVIVEGIDAAKNGGERGDLLAHLGWIYFLRTRDGESNLDPSQSYAKAIEQDPKNPFAHAMWGHWILFTNGSFEEARRHFTEAVSSGRAQEEVRYLQLGALFERLNTASGDELMKAANTIRLEHGTIEPAIRDRFFRIYRERLLFKEDTPDFLQLLSPQEHLDTFLWLFPDQKLFDGSRPEYSVCLAYLLVSASKKQDAANLLNPLKAKEDQYSLRVRDAVDEMLKRLK